MRIVVERNLSTPLLAGRVLVPPAIPDHELLGRIGAGAYGEVWLARTALGTLRAVKMVYRAHFKEDRPYEREFNGILKYEPISRTHEGLVQVLHAGRNDGAGCFYYVMELADAAGEVEKGRKVARENLPHSPSLPLAPAPYAPRTLRSEVARQQRLPPADAAQLVLRLAVALGHLHAHGLVHRDIKPSNVIFVGGQPKLADIGLVTDVGSSNSFVGTEGFIPPEGPGTPQADLYGLGKLLYELVTGRDRMDFPQLPPLSSLAPSGGETAGARSAESEALLELNEIMTRACTPDPKQRYANAAELQAELKLFLAGSSLRRARHVERNLARLRKFAVTACAFLLVAAVALWISKREEWHALEKAREATGRARSESESRAKESALRRRAEAAERETEQQLHTALLEQARATVRSGEMGHRVRALEALRRAGAISNTVELRREVFAALALPDLRFERELPYGEEFTVRVLDPAFERIALGRRRGPIEIRSVPGDQLLATLPASTNFPAHYAMWSADGRHLAVKRDRSDGGWRTDWEVWEPAAPRRVLLFQDVPRLAASFHPRLPRFLVGRRTGDLSIWNLEDGAELFRLPRVSTPAQLEFAPDGGRIAATHGTGAGWTLTVYDAASGRSLVSKNFTDVVPSFAWHPGGRWLAATDKGGAVHWMDAQTGETRVLGRHKAEAATVTFSANGAHLFSGGWDREIICWDARTLRRAFTVSLDGADILASSDGRRCAVRTDSGLQLHRFEAPSGFREFAEDLGTRVRHAAFSPDGRWLAASASRGAGVWDLAQGGPGAVAENAFEAHFFFTLDGRQLLASRSRQGSADCFRWQITPAPSSDQPPKLEPLPIARPKEFSFLSLSSNSAVVTGANGSQVLALADLEAGGDDWRRTHPGVNGISPDGRWLAIHRPFSSSLYVHRLPGLERVAKLTHPASISDFEFSPQGDELAIASSGKGAKLWSTRTWEITRTLPNVARILYAPDARTLWLTRDLRTAGLYDARTLEPCLLLPSGMLPLALSPDGRQLAVSVDAQRIQVWDLAELRKHFRELKLDWPERPTH